MNDTSHLRTPLSKVRGLGSAHSGAHHWWLERLTSLALVPLSVWFLFGLLTHLGNSRAVVAAWLAKPLVSLTFAALMLITFLHAKMGLQVIIEDYVHTEPRKYALVIFKDLCVYVAALATIFAIVKLHFIGIR